MKSTVIMSNKRIQELDVLRGIAALIVVGFHYITRYNQIYEHTFDGTHVFYVLRLGVPLFFMISGFVIYLTLERVSGVGDFLYRRFTRLYPTYWLSLFITFVTVAIFGLPGREVALSEAWWNVSMIQELLGYRHVDGVYWSLLPELMFYALMALLIPIREKNYLIGLSLVWTIVMWLQLQYHFVPELWSKVLNLKYGAFFLSGMHFYQLFKGKNKAAHHLFIWAGFYLSTLFYQANIEQVFVFGCYALFYLFIYGHLKRLVCSPLVMLGHISYALYLLHQNIGYIVLNRLKDLFGYTTWWMLLIPLTLSLGLAYIVTFYAERPLMQWLRTKHAK